MRAIRLSIADERLNSLGSFAIAACICRYYADATDHANTTPDIQKNLPGLQLYISALLEVAPPTFPADDRSHLQLEIVFVARQVFEDFTRGWIIT